MFDDDFFMKIAISEAKAAYEENEVPIGAVIVIDNKIISKAHNQVEKLKDSTAHAEIIAITSASEFLSSKYLTNATLYITLEPCVMCAGAIFWSKINRIVYGAKDEKYGYSIVNNQIFQTKTQIKSGILADECSELIKKFFLIKRKF